MTTDKSGRTSAGILLWRTRKGRLEVLLAHHGGPFWAKKDIGHWTIPKGEVEPGEEFVAVEGDLDPARGLRERAVSDPRAAEILLRWLQRPRTEERVGDVDLDSMFERELERLHAGLLKLAALPEQELRALVASLLADAQDE